MVLVRVLAIEAKGAGNCQEGGWQLPGGGLAIEEGAERVGNWLAIARKGVQAIGWTGLPIARSRGWQLPARGVLNCPDGWYHGGGQKPGQVGQYSGIIAKTDEAKEFRKGGKN